MHTVQQAMKRLSLDQKIQREAWLEKIENEVVDHVDTQTLFREDLFLPYYFVEQKYPQVSKVISGITIYKNDNTALWRRLGLENAAGLYIRPLTMVLIMYSPNVPDDVVAVHELLHCAHDKMMLGNATVAQEDMTFRASIPYLRQRKFADQWIVDNYLFPYFFSLHLSRNPHLASTNTISSTPSGAKSVSDIARDKCWKILEEEKGHAEPLPCEHDEPFPDTDRFDFID